MITPIQLLNDESNSILKNDSINHKIIAINNDECNE